MLHSVVPLLHAIADARNATRLGTVRATIECASRLDAVPNDLAMAMGACRGKRMNGALEAVERARRTLRTDHLKRLVVIVSADVTFRHQAISTSDGCIEHFVVFIYLMISPRIQDSSTATRNSGSTSDCYGGESNATERIRWIWRCSMSERDSRAQHGGRDQIRAEIDMPPTPPDPNRPLPIPKTPPAPPTPTDEPPPEPVEDPPAESEPKPPYTVGGNVTSAVDAFRVWLSPAVRLLARADRCCKPSGLNPSSPA